jgi:hypothetical protein
MAEDELYIKFIGHRYYLKAIDNTDSELPPSLFLKFNITNNTNSDKIFFCRADKFDYLKTRMYILDTIQKSKIELFSSDIQIIKSKENIEIEAKINIRSNVCIFNLDKSFFKKFDFTGDKKKLDDILISIKKNSVVIYSQDTSDLSYFRLQNPKIKPLKKKEYKILW